ncbi:MAG TPA: IPT/TIG domain-containing protein [Planctomycetota bacterium]|nr:IPT/TIG domain-containing protein [Planctomycetota bacterium]
MSPLARMWDLEQTEQRGQLSVYNSVPTGGHYGMPVELGDLDGDGAPDLVVAPMAAAGLGGTRAESGEVYVYVGRGEISGEIDHAAPGGPPPGLTLVGARAGDFLGSELFIADVNGDGTNDLLVGAQNYDGIDGTRDSAGGVFVLFGRPGLFSEGHTVIDLLEPPEGILTIVGANPGDRLGIWVEAGDLDGDGLSDILIGADQGPAASSADQRFHNGLVVVIYGHADLPRVIDLAALAVTEPPVGNPSEPTTNGVSVILGEDREDHFGCSLHAADLDMDGRAELIASAALTRLSASRNAGFPVHFPAHGNGGADGPGNERRDAGEVKIFFSSPDGARLPAVLDLAQPLPPRLQGRVTTIFGAIPESAQGEEVTSGDFNGDGHIDLVIGALAATVTPPGTSQAGIAHVIYGQDGLAGTTIDLAPGAPAGRPPGLVVSRMYGLHVLDILGDTLSAGDFDNDGFDDLAIGIPMHDLPGKENTGIVAVAFGRTEPWPEDWAPQSEDLPPGLQVAYVLGRAAGDLLSYSMEVLDYDGDGYADLFPNAQRGDGRDDLHPNAGEAYLVSGYELSGVSLGVTSVEPGMGPAGTPTPVTVRGSGFTTSEDTRLFVAGTEVTGSLVVNGSRIEAVFPPRGLPGIVDVRVETRYGSASLAGAFRYVFSGPSFIRADASLDGMVDVSDAITILFGLFASKDLLCPDAADANDDGALNLTDVIHILHYLFLGSDPPPPPFPDPGTDPTPDDLGCP